MPKHRKNQKWKSRNQIDGFQIRYYDPEPFNYGQNFDYSQYYNDPIPLSSCVVKESQGNKNVAVNITPEDNNEIRTIKREDLYRNPEVQSYIHHNNYKLSNLKNDMKYWRKEEMQLPSEVLEKGKSRKKNDKRKNEFEKKLNKMLAKPAEISKGKSMLEKMGWKGGGLGKDGAGMLEPIIPKATYATKSFGLGHVTVPEQVEERDDDLEFNNYFRTNVLLHILEFIKNDLEVDLLFDVALWRCERKRVHNIVQELRKCEDVEELAYDNPIDTAIAGDIIRHNMYLLVTKSAGKAPNRQLCVFKDAPAHIYLIVPDDLKDVIVDEKSKKKYVKVPKKESDIEQFTKQVKALEVKNDEIISNEQTKSETDTPRCILRKLVDYFKEFAENTNYTEYRLLGPFDNEEVDAIRLFFEICLKKETARCEEREELLEALNNALLEFEVKEDRDRLVIFKHERTHQLQPQEVMFV
ncbi:uncharacterized protein LOC124541236 isoform X2 [Vanessa cardui]|uniref:uncharacterized protein LOC124541236 isoform X2 n=1 Tax=Vanessa cardui TaxID=171605 RepID=UPI001F13DB8F|nr:uncharacterized protein LOC124541236 isoform X2 [Vanessa cardui]